MSGTGDGDRDHRVPDSSLRSLVVRNLQIEYLEHASVPLHLVAFDLLSGDEVRHPDGTDAAVQAFTLFVGIRLQADLARYATTAELIVLAARTVLDVAPVAEPVAA
ncbi:MAG TPA: hypothetical protein VFI54_13060 [Solirubrobacteraceae bacterium]|nr:hypothetical protein [Solirubrobacteraceae bacterium]